MQTVWLTLSDGSRWRGFCDESVNVEGEVVFTTASCGAPQSVSDPSYCGQILVFAFPPIGIYGADLAALESERPWTTAVVVQEIEETPDMAATQFAAWLEGRGVPLVRGVDCRNLILHLRESGTLMGHISAEPQLPEATNVSDNMVATVSCDEVQVFGEGALTIGVMDYGVKHGILRALLQRGCRVVRFPHDADAATVLGYDLDGLILSNGPGDPEHLPYEVETVRRLLGRVPLFGICLGNQLLARACGAQTMKLPYGHRGANQPVQDLATGRAYVTSQNHGYTVVEESLPGTGLAVSFRHLGDATVEGVRHEAFFASGVQFHPEACPGPQDTEYLFDEFLDQIRGGMYHACA